RNDPAGLAGVRTPGEGTLAPAGRGHVARASQPRAYVAAAAIARRQRGRNVRGIPAFRASAVQLRVAPEQPLLVEGDAPLAAQVAAQAPVRADAGVQRRDERRLLQHPPRRLREGVL